MKRLTISIMFLLLLISNIYSQSTNFRAQGKYYSAKRELEAKQFAAALNYIRECKDLLSGKSNIEIQYIHIIAAYKAGEFFEAQKEVERFFNLYDKKEEAVAFDKTVESLTGDEVREITKLIDLVDEGVKAQQVKARQQPWMDAAAYIQSRAVYIAGWKLDGRYIRVDSTSGTLQVYDTWLSLPTRINDVNGWVIHHSISPFSSISLNNIEKVVVKDTGDGILSVQIFTKDAKTSVSAYNSRFKHPIPSDQKYEREVLGYIWYFMDGDKNRLSDAFNVVLKGMPK